MDETFKIKITELLSKTIDVKAETSDEAYTKAVDMYKDAKIVLTYEDYVETDFEWVQEENTPIQRGLRATLPLLEEK